MAAVYLPLETRAPALQEDFRRRALGAGLALFPAAGLALLASGPYAPRVRDALIFAAWALPLHLLTAGAAVTALAALWRRRWRLARRASPGHVSCLLWGWALRHSPSIAPPHLTVP